MSKRDPLQDITVEYLTRLIPKAREIGLEEQLYALIEKNKKGECFATKEQGDMLSRLLNDSNIKLTQIPNILHVSYRFMCEHDYFCKFIRKFDNKGNFSKIDTIILRDKLKKKK